MDHLLTEIAGMLDGVAAMPVRVAPPAAGEEGVFVWPWRARVDPVMRSSPLPARDTAGVPAPVVHIDWLLVVQLADAAAALATLVACWRALEAHPLVQRPEGEGRIAASPLPHADLCGLFLAAGIPLRPSMSFSLTVVDRRAGI
ncbi:MAG: hypothetical protein R2834_19425 [Rhodothermales bacterium]